MVRIFDDPYGTSSKFATPGVGPNGLYIGTGDGFVVGYGATVNGAISGSPVDFGPVLLGHSLTRDVVLQASQATQITTMSVDSSVYVLQSPPALPLSVAAGGTVTIPVTFSPVRGGDYPGSLAIVTTSGSAGISLDGEGQANGPELAVGPKSLTFGGVPPGSFERLNLLVENEGMQPMVFTGVESPSSPFTVTGGPAVGDVVAPGAAVTLSVTYAPEAAGTYTDSLSVASTGGNRTVYISGTSSPPGMLQIMPTTLDFGPVQVGHTGTLTFVVNNAGGSRLEISQSKPPSSPQFVATTQLPEGTLIPAGNQLVETVVFQPSSAGTFQDSWVINSTYATAAVTVTMTGVGLEGADAGSD
jgi:iron transport multicopper oxidase